MNLLIHPNVLYYGDCLEIMRNFPDEYVDLICLDPPFNSNRRYNTIFKNSGLSIEPQIKAFSVFHTLISFYPDPVGAVLRRTRPNAICIPNRTGSS